MRPPGTSRSSQPGATCPCTRTGNRIVQDNNKAAGMDYTAPWRDPQLDTGIETVQKARQQSGHWGPTLEEERMMEQTKPEAWGAPSRSTAIRMDHEIPLVPSPRRTR